MISRAKSLRGLPTRGGSEMWLAAVRHLALVLLVGTSLLAQDAPVIPNVSITGVVKSGNTPIPGATVTAVSSSTQEKTATSTDTNGSYTLQVAPGKYQLRVDMPAFASSTREVVVGDPGARADLELTLLSRTQQAVRPQQRPTGMPEAIEGSKARPCCKGWPAPRPITPAGRTRSFLPECRCQELRRMSPRNRFHFLGAHRAWVCSA